MLVLRRSMCLTLDFGLATGYASALAASLLAAHNTDRWLHKSHALQRALSILLCSTNVRGGG
jgi:hypothetical protein